MALSILSSCSMESPFNNEGEGRVSISAVMQGEVDVDTRAIDDEELSSLRESCTIWITREGSKDVLKRFKGLDNIPDWFNLKVGTYFADAWAGDSVSASFDKKFYRAFYEKFEVSNGNNDISLKCKIANVVVSIDPSALGLSLTDLRITVSNTRGQLVFDESNISTNKGYFMMPNSSDTSLNYKIEGTTLDGQAYSKEGTISNVQRAHEYMMSITENEAEITQGGALIKVTVEDIPIIDKVIDVFPAPCPHGVDFDINEQVVSTERNFNDVGVCIRGYYGLNSVNIKFSDNFNFSSTDNNLDALNNSVTTSLRTKGIDIEKQPAQYNANVEGGKVPAEELFITFKKSFLDNLLSSSEEYYVEFTSIDKKGQQGVGRLRIANSVDAVESLPPVVVGDAPDPKKSPMAITGTQATLTGYIYNSEEAKNYGIEYREDGSNSDFTKCYASSSSSAAAPSNKQTRADNIPFTVILTGLTPGKTYEYRVFCDGFEGSETKKFTTESKFIIPNASFEDWSTYSASTLLGTKSVILPGNTGDKLTSFWGSGNEGGATANKVLTDKSTDMKHSGQYSAKLASTAAVGVIAAGNIFVGHYDRTDGTNGVLQLGREYNGSHPTKVRVYANYRPGGGVSGVTDSNKEFVGITNNGTDQGQVYVALTDGPIEIRTKPDNRKLFDGENDPHVLAYGQVTWTDNFGDDGTLKEVLIPFAYKELAKTKRPTHLVIVASASKFGDYFCGSKESVMYLDDFELVYE